MIDPSDPYQVLIRRVFYVQMIMVVAALVLLGVAYVYDLGFFWFAFVAGIFGASVDMVHRANSRQELAADHLVRSWSSTLSPLLYGAMMAAVVYFLFVSDLLSGSDGDGLLTSNLFPDFTDGGASSAQSSAFPNKFGLVPEADKDLAGVSVKQFLDCRPSKLSDMGKLIIWCFLAGYSESFVTGILKRLESSSTA